jgi:hypothetical protein
MHMMIAQNIIVFAILNYLPKNTSQENYSNLDCNDCRITKLFQHKDYNIICVCPLALMDTFTKSKYLYEV